MDPQEEAVSGMSCISPIAAAGEAAFQIRRFLRWSPSFLR